MTGTWWAVGAWLVALALCARWIWRSTKVDEIMSRGWLEENVSGEEEDDGASEAEDVREAKRLQEGILQTYRAEEGIEEVNRFGQADLDSFDRDSQAASERGRAPRSSDRRRD